MSGQSFKSFKKRQNRLLLEATLKPLQGTLFTPANYPNTGPVIYSHNGVDELIVEFFAKMANACERPCLDASERGLLPLLEGVSYAEARNREDDTFKTTTLQESHRLASRYFREAIMEDGTLFKDYFNQLCDVKKGNLLDKKLFYATLFRCDAFALLHGIMMAQYDAQMQVTRVLSARIEAHNAQLVSVGGAKVNTLDMQGKNGDGNVPYTKEYGQGDLRAYFNIDLHLLRSFQLPEEANEMLFALALWKIRMVLEEGLRLRSECDLGVVGELQCTNMDFQVPSLEELEESLPGLIKQCAPYMNGRTVLYYTTPIITTTPKKTDENGEQKQDEEE